MTVEQKPKREINIVYDASKLKGELKDIGGSMSDGWNNLLADQVVRTLGIKGLDEDETRRKCQAVGEAMIGIKPRDEIEGMLIAQLIACHNASMDCYRWAKGADTLE